MGDVLRRRRILGLVPSYINPCKVRCLMEIRTMTAEEKLVGLWWGGLGRLDSVSLLRVLVVYLLALFAYYLSAVGLCLLFRVHLSVLDR